MKPDKAPAYWPTRILLAIAFISTALVVAGTIWSAFWPPETLSGPPTVWGVPHTVVMDVLFATMAVIGLIWIIRIFRGHRSQPPLWRYRDR